MVGDANARAGASPRCLERFVRGAHFVLKVRTDTCHDRASDDLPAGKIDEVRAVCGKTTVLLLPISRAKLPTGLLSQVCQEPDRVLPTLCLYPSRNSGCAREFSAESW